MLSWLVISQWKNVIMVTMTLDTSALASLWSSPLGKMEELGSSYCIFCASFIEMREERHLGSDCRYGCGKGGGICSQFIWLLISPCSHLCLDQPLSLFSMQPVLFPPEIPTSGHFRLASYFSLPFHKSIFSQGRKTGFIPSLGIE